MRPDQHHWGGASDESSSDGWVGAGSITEGDCTIWQNPEPATEIVAPPSAVTREVAVMWMTAGMTAFARIDMTVEDEKGHIHHKQPMTTTYYPPDI